MENAPMVLESRFMPALTIRLIVVTRINGMEGELESILQALPMPIDR